jgi:hypothetical protein
MNVYVSCSDMAPDEKSAQPQPRRIRLFTWLQEGIASGGEADTEAQPASRLGTTLSCISVICKLRKNLESCTGNCSTSIEMKYCLLPWEQYHFSVSVST